VTATTHRQQMGSCRHTHRWRETLLENAQPLSVDGHALDQRLPLRVQLSKAGRHALQTG
jgi:hypothetical protein